MKNKVILQNQALQNVRNHPVQNIEDILFHFTYKEITASGTYAA